MHPVPSAPFPNGATRVTGLQLALALAFRFNDLFSDLSQLHFSCAILSITSRLKRPSTGMGTGPVTPAPAPSPVVTSMLRSFAVSLGLKGAEAA